MDGICIMQAIAPNHEVDMAVLEEHDEDDSQAHPQGVPAHAQHPLLAQSKVAGVNKREVIADNLFNIFNEL